MTSRKRTHHSAAYSTEQSDSDDTDYAPSMMKSRPANCGTDSKVTRNPTRVPTCFNRNAVMARENRERKKRHTEILEASNAKLNRQKQQLESIVDNQSFVIAELRKQLKHVSAVLANSAEIGQLLRTVHRSTGMSVASSLTSGNLKRAVIKQTHSVSGGGKTAGPWQSPQSHIDDADSSSDGYHSSNYPSFPTPPENVDLDPMMMFPTGSCDDFLNMPLLGDDALIFDNGNDSSMPDLQKASTSFSTPLEEHDYVPNPYEAGIADCDGAVGVCLHVSNKRVTLEFCASCAESSTDTWKELDLGVK